MILKHLDTQNLKHSDSAFDADDWASVGVPRALLLLGKCGCSESVIAFEVSTFLTQPAFDLPLMS